MSQLWDDSNTFCLKQNNRSVVCLWLQWNEERSSSYAQQQVLKVEILNVWLGFLLFDPKKITTNTNFSYLYFLSHQDDGLSLK